MPTPTFESEFVPLWAAFVAFSKNPANSDLAVEAAEKQCDQDVNDLLLKYSHPGGIPDRRR